MPRKGTEICTTGTLCALFAFGNEMPRKGTETKYFFCHNGLLLLFGNEMPRKGTETLHVMTERIQNVIWK